MISRVRLNTGKEDRELSVDQFLKLPLDERIQMILEQHVSFFDEDKQLMDRQEALKELRTWRRCDVGSKQWGEQARTGVSETLRQGKVC